MDKFDQWAIIELFGHSKIAGKVTEQIIGGSSFVRIDVPEIKPIPKFTKLYGQGAIYSMVFVDEETAIAAANSFRICPVDEWSARQMLKAIGITDLSKKELTYHDEENDDL